MPSTSFVPRMVRRFRSEMLVDLRQRRAWFAGEGGTGDGQGGNDELGDYRAATLEEQQKVTAALLKRLKERDAEKSQLQNQIAGLNERMTASERAAKKKLEEEGNYKTLLDQTNAELEGLKAYKERAALLDDIIRKGNDALIQRLPEDRRGIVPMEYPPEKLRTWLDANFALLTKQPAPDFDAGAGAGSGSNGSAAPPKLTDEEKQWATAAGMTEKAYAEYKNKRGQPVELKKPPGS